MRNRIEFEPKQEKAICQEYRKGVSLEALAFEYSVSVTVIRRALKENGIPFKRRGVPGRKPIASTVAKAKSLRSMGLTIAVAAGFMGMSERTYSRLIAP